LSDIHFIDSPADVLSYLKEKGYSSVFILADENTAEQCYPLLPEELKQPEKLITIPAGEEQKNLVSAEDIWIKLLLQEADRNSVLLNLGGGMITDLGGFAASVFKRGIPFIHIPTTLLGMVDAAIGGKTGINFAHFKNQLGTFTLADAVFICPAFLQTLPQRELISGFAEVIKYGLIADLSFWKELKKMDPAQVTDWLPIIKKCVETKQEVTAKDPKEKGLRKILNFGHTVGHAIESYSLDNDNAPLLHGEAIAIGMICEVYISMHKSGLLQTDFESIRDHLSSIFPAYRISKDIYPQLLEYIRGDKKNANGSIQMVCLKAIGEAVYGISCSEEEIMAALNYYIAP
jgi:3-dehydroquinate synthase